jgi:PIN domain nuclease of toxin-antitoxin system
MSTFLLDTHAVLWWFTDSPRLSNTARSILSDENSQLRVSAASGWEIATKSRIGKLDHAPAVVDELPGLMARNGFIELAVSMRHALRAGSLAGVHRDPFDRMIAAQSIIASLPVITTDPAIEFLGATTIW